MNGSLSRRGSVLFGVMGVGAFKALSLISVINFMERDFSRVARERQRQRQREGQTERETETDRETKRERGREREKEREMAAAISIGNNSL